MHDFLSNNRDEIIKRCRIKILDRINRSATQTQLKNGIPIFLEQIIQILQLDEKKTAENSIIPERASSNTITLDVNLVAAQHGRDLLSLGYTIDQVVHDYGNLCQAITELAIERNFPFTVEEFRTLNGCLDTAIADAVTEFSYQKEILNAESKNLETIQRLGFFAHELRNILATACLAFAAAKAGNLSLSGATGIILERHLQLLSKLIEDTLTEVKINPLDNIILNSFSLADFVSEINDTASLSANAQNCSFKVTRVDPTLAISGLRELLMAAVANLLQNAFKFTQKGTEVSLAAYSLGDKILIDVKDHGGGNVQVTDSIFLPFSQEGENRTGIGLGLTIAKQSVIKSGGTLTVKTVAGIGCIFTITLPRHVMPT